MTPRTASSSMTWLALGAALLLAPAAGAQTAAAPDLSESLTNLAAKAADGLSAQKAIAAQRVEALNDGWGAVPTVPVMVLAARVTPDYAYTPGHLCSPTDPNFKEYRYAEHIPYCNRNVTQRMKLTVAQHYTVAFPDPCEGLDPSGSGLRCLLSAPRVRICSRSLSHAAGDCHPIVPIYSWPVILRR